MAVSASFVASSHTPRCCSLPRASFPSAWYPPLSPPNRWPKSPDHLRRSMDSPCDQAPHPPCKTACKPAREAMIQFLFYFFYFLEIDLWRWILQWFLEASAATHPYKRKGRGSWAGPKAEKEKKKKEKLFEFRSHSFEFKLNVNLT